MTAPAAVTIAPAPAPPAIPPADPARRANSMVDRLLQRHGSAEAALAYMASQAVTAEDTIEQRDRTITELRSKVPAEGSLVLAPDAAKQWAKLQDLKLTPDEIEKAVKERDALKGEVTVTAAKTAARGAAKAAGLDEDAFEVHALREGLVIEMRDVQTTEAGKPVTKKLPFVRKGADEKAPLTPISDYTNALPAHDQRALRPGSATVIPTPVPYTPQGPTTTADASGDPVKGFAAARNAADAKRPNPLRPAGAAAS